MRSGQIGKQRPTLTMGSDRIAKAWIRESCGEVVISMLQLQQNFPVINKKSLEHHATQKYKWVRTERVNQSSISVWTIEMTLLFNVTDQVILFSSTTKGDTKMAKLTIGEAIDIKQETITYTITRDSGSGSWVYMLDENGANTEQVHGFECPKDAWDAAFEFTNTKLCSIVHGVPVKLYDQREVVGINGMRD